MPLARALADHVQLDETDLRSTDDARLTMHGNAEPHENDMHKLLTKHWQRPILKGR